jgi:hypothetical protein
MLKQLTTMEAINEERPQRHACPGISNPHLQRPHLGLQYRPCAVCFVKVDEGAGYQNVRGESDPNRWESKGSALVI